jgi:hypothetical protein
MWEILSKKNIIELWLRSGGSNTRVAYAMSILLGRGIVERVASGVYIVQNETKNIEMWKYYWQIIAKLIDVHSPSGGVIGWEKALELHLSNYSTPDILIIYTRDTALRIKLTDGREVHMRTLVSGPKTGKKNLWRTLADNAIEANPPTHFNMMLVLRRRILLVFCVLLVRKSIVRPSEIWLDCGISVHSIDSVSSPVIWDIRVSMLWLSRSYRMREVDVIWTCRLNPIESSRPCIMLKYIFYSFLYFSSYINSMYTNCTSIDMEIESFLGNGIFFPIMF